MPFEEGHEKHGGIKKGTKHKRTKFIQALSERIEEFDDTLFTQTKKFLNHKNEDIRLTAWKELLKYRLPREVKADLTNNGKEFAPPVININVKESK